MPEKFGQLQKNDYLYIKLKNIIKQRRAMRTNVRNIEVKGQQFKVWSDFIQRGTFAENENGEIKQLHGSGYIHAERTVKKAIRTAYFN